MSTPRSYDGTTLREMFRLGTLWLEKNARAIDNLNVFPVPDGDTGTNMLLTMRSTLEQAAQCQDPGASAVASAMAHGALLGARGNSGVILSQVLHGLALGLDRKGQFDSRDFAQALSRAAETAYKGITQPVEGTMLTVIREAAEAAGTAVARDGLGMAELMEQVLAAARVSLENTPNLLPVLKESGVVDAGGQGLVVLLEGALAHLEGRPLGEGYQTLGQIRQDWLETASALHQDEAGPPWGYCTEFLVRGDRVSPDLVQQEIAKMGSSVLVVGDAGAVRVHLHTLEPGAALSLATSLGTLHSVKIENMQEQHAALLQAQRARKKSPPVPVVAIVAGEGLAQVFRSLGVTEIVPGGQSMNPSTQQVAAAVDAIDTEGVLVLPNNPNVLQTCRQAHLLSAKQVLIVPSKTIPQGVAALLALNQEKSLEENAQAMERNLSAVRTIEITAATRTAKVGGVAVKAGQPIGLLDHDLLAAGTTPLDAFEAVLDKLRLSPNYLITLYYGEMVSQEDAEAVAQSLRARPDQPEVEVVWGGQPFYHYIGSVEA